MTETSSIVHTITALIQTTAKLVSISYGYISGVQRSPKTLHELVDELHALSKILVILRDHADREGVSTGDTSLESLLQRHGLLEKCSSDLDDLCKSIEPDGGYKGVINGLEWPMEDAKTSGYILAIGRLRSFFKCALIRNDSVISANLSNRFRRKENPCINVKDDEGMAPLDLAVFAGNVDIVRMLLAAGSDARTYYPESALFADRTLLARAVERGNYEIVRMLIEHGAEVPKDEPILHLAIPSRSTRLIKLLLDNGADPTIKEWRNSSMSLSPLNYALNSGLKDITLLLLERTPPSIISEKSNYNESTALHRALRNRGFEAVVRILVDKGADISAQSPLGTPVEVAASQPSEQNLRLLLDKGADMSAKSSRDHTLLHRAVRGGHEENVKLLLSRGADVMAQDIYDNTPLHNAVTYKRWGMIKLLMDSGASSSIKNIRGNTPFEQENMDTE